VQVGRLVAFSAGAVPRLLERFEQVYGGVGKTESIIARAAAHHRLLWVHPFLDGNGRVARLMSHAKLLGTLDTGAVWSVALGLARNVQEYKGLLANCDLPRRNDLDGYGNFSEEALAEFTRFFLTARIDQVTFMEGLMQPDRLRTRILIWVEEEIRLGILPPKSGSILEAVLYRGELPRGEADTVVGTGERQAPHCFGIGGTRRTGVRRPARAVASHLLGCFGASLDARLVPGEDRATRKISWIPLSRCISTLLRMVGPTLGTAE
jgi:hypothetical protein